ncbi:MAG: hypothetical protein H7647_06725, partial [Candidatus Heimdallarchaeota archaeon]|nr:hypothetical protein [Candidatus Heimdallarchaeota archaeon]MCK4254120.1 hypothetical protein [Candidatus Heimdallarchaeota archaeon]
IFNSISSSRMNLNDLTIPSSAIQIALPSSEFKLIDNEIKRKLEEYNLNRVIVTGSGSDVIYQYLKNKMIYGELILATNIIRSAEINSAYCIAYLYAKKMIVDG